MATNSARPSAEQAVLGQFAEQIAAAGPCPGDIIQNGDFYRVHCPFPGPEGDPHQAKGAPQVYLWYGQGEVHGHCDKCIGHKDQLPGSSSTKAARLHGPPQGAGRLDTDRPDRHKTRSSAATLFRP